MTMLLSTEITSATPGPDLSGAAPAVPPWCKVVQGNERLTHSGTTDLTSLHYGNEKQYGTFSLRTRG